MLSIGQTDVGKVRSSNQDSFACGTFDDGTAWAVVCDGMGGMNGGDVASSLSVNVITDYLSENYDKKLRPKQLFTMFSEAADKACNALAERVEAEPELCGMGTTLVVAVVRGKKAYIGHAGDSRAYIIGKKARQITKDHSFVQELVDSGRITAQEAREHPRKNVITRALGTSRTVRIDFDTARIRRRRKLLICSDGLTNCVTDDELAALAGSVPADELPDKYIAAANDGGGRDNITAVIICNISGKRGAAGNKDGAE